MRAWNAKWQCYESWSSKKRVCKNYNFRGKNYGIRTPYVMLESQLLYQLCYMCFADSNGMLLCFFVFNSLQSTNWTPRELLVINLEVGRQWVYDIRQLKCRCRQFQAIYRHDGQSERQTQTFVLGSIQKWCVPLKLPPIKTILRIS